VNQTKFDPEACHRAFGQRVAAIYGWPTREARLDERLVFYLRLVAETDNLVAGRHLLDLGPGLAAFGPVARAMGLEVTLIDDFGGGGGVEREQREKGLKIMSALRDQLGVRLIELDFLQAPLPAATGSVDVVTCFHSLEHWHHSPKRLFQEIRRVLRPNGFLILATPNAVNVRKRCYAAIGKNPFPDLNEWYHGGDPVFRGHVREPTIRDLHQILEWNGFEVISTYGRNFIGQHSTALRFLPKGFVKGVAVGSDFVLRFVPSLCSDIHVTGRRRD
jgi:SAM-dependent methyltransferase